MSKFTPGPWYASNALHPFKVMSASKNICDMIHPKMFMGKSEDPEFSEQQYYNSKLIAAAPDMYELLKVFSTAYTTSQIDEDAKQAAIALLNRIDNG